MGSPLQAARLTQLCWNIAGVTKSTRMELLWLDQLQQPHLLPLKATGRACQDLAVNAGWKGIVTGVGLIVRAPLSSPLTVRDLVLRPKLPEPAHLLGLLWHQWTVFEPWHGYSEHLIMGGAGELLGPAPVAALWVMLSVLVYVAVGGLRRGRRQLMPFMLLFMGGWLLLDMRWQWNLVQQLEQTVASMAGKTRSEKLRHYDGELYSFVHEAEQRLPRRPVRVFLLSSDPGGYAAGRARYYLAPYNVYKFLREPPPSRLTRPGDYLLVLVPVKGVQFRRTPGHETILWGHHRLAVKLVTAGKEGLLLQIEKSQ